MSLYSELKRRNVFRVAIAYLALAWLLTEVAGTLFPVFGIPDWGVRFVVIVLALGYVPALVFSWIYELTPEGIKREQDVVRDASITHLTARRLDLFTIGIIVVALAFILGDRLWLTPRSEESSALAVEALSDTAQTDETAKPESQYPPNSIAVLPFVNMSEDTNNEYFADGISEELLNLLARIPELTVAARTSSFSFKGRNVEIPEIAKRLKVSHVLEGSVRKSGEQVRITAQLIKADDGFHLWSESFDRQLDDIFAIQDEIAEAVVSALKVTLLDVAQKTDPIDPEAYVLYLQAEQVGKNMRDEALEQSNVLLKKALSIAPDYARAWRLLARNYAEQADRGVIPRGEGVAMARKAVMQALAIDPDLAEANSWLGVWEAQNGGDMQVAAQRIQHALQQEPRNFNVISHSAGFLDVLGRLEEALSVREYLVNRDPLNPIAHNNLAWTYLSLGRPKDALAVASTLQMLSPDYVRLHSLRSSALLDMGEVQGALHAIQQEKDESWRLYLLARIYHASGQAVETANMLNEYIEKYGPANPLSVASLLAFLGEADRAFVWLDKTVASGLVQSWITDRYWFADLPNDPRWLPFLESIDRSPAQLDAIEFSVTLPE